MDRGNGGHVRTVTALDAGRRVTHRVGRGFARAKGAGWLTLLMSSGPGCRPASPFTRCVGRPAPLARTKLTDNEPQRVGPSPRSRRLADVGPIYQRLLFSSPEAANGSTRRPWPTQGARTGYREGVHVPRAVSKPSLVLGRSAVQAGRQHREYRSLGTEVASNRPNNCKPGGSGVRRIRVQAGFSECGWRAASQVVSRSAVFPCAGECIAIPRQVG